MEFNNDQLLPAIEREGYEYECLRVEKEAKVAAQASTEVFPGSAWLELKEEDAICPEWEQEPATNQDREPQ